jgi:hypothetical protein
MRISRQPLQYRLWQIKNSRRMWNILIILLAIYQMLHDIHVKLNPGISWQKHHSRRRRFFTIKFYLNSRKKLLKVLNLKHSFVWCWKLDTWESRSRMPGKFWNVVLEKDGEDKWAQIVWEMKESRRGRILHKKYKEG